MGPEARLTQDWADRIGPEAAAWNRKAIRWQLVILATSVLFVLFVWIFRGSGSSSLAFKIGSFWVPWIIIASSLRTRNSRHARQAAARFLGFTGKAQHIPVGKIEKFDVWYARMKNSQWMHGVHEIADGTASTDS